MTDTIFELSDESRDTLVDHQLGIPEEFLRDDPIGLPNVSEPQVVRHYTRLSQLNFSIDTNFYPLGSCTMKYNPRAAHRAASAPGFLDRHPLTPDSRSQGVLQCLYQLQELLCRVTGMSAVSLAPMAGAQGELAGVLMIRRFHESRRDLSRNEILVPTAAHGTNPATATMCGYKVRDVDVNDEGNIDLGSLEENLSETTAGIMLTNPSTCAVFEPAILEIADMVHEAGGLLYYDGANLNSILCQVRPADMGFDVLHVNLHKTFATPHGGGGPGSGPIGVGERLERYLPQPIVIKEGSSYRWSTPDEIPESIGRLSAFMGNAGILIRALAYAMMLGREGMKQVSNLATLNANYLMKCLLDVGLHAAYPTRRATHEFIITLKEEAESSGITAMDVAKRLLDYGIHAPTTYFPLLVPECFLIEPTETENKKTLDRFVEVMAKILEDARNNPDLIKNAPYELPVSRIDEIKAARELVLTHSDAMR